VSYSIFITDDCYRVKRIMLTDEQKKIVLSFFKTEGSPKLKTTSDVYDFFRHNHPAIGKLLTKSTLKKWKKKLVKSMAKGEELTATGKREPKPMYPRLNSHIMYIRHTHYRTRIGVHSPLFSLLCSSRISKNYANPTYWD
jgi:hypothetical protein